MKKLSNDKEYTGRNVDKTYFHMSLALSCTQVVLRGNYMVEFEAKQQEVAWEVMSFLVGQFTDA